MKKILLSMAMVIMATTTAFAGYTGPLATSQKLTAAEVKKAKDDTKGYLEGYVISRVHDEDYTFQDSTGTVIVEIDKDITRYNNFNEKTLVRLYGEVDAEFMKDNSFDVDSMQIIKQ